MEHVDLVKASISDQKARAALLIYQFAKQRNLAIKNSTDVHVAFLTALLHLAEQDGVDFNAALGKARVRVLNEKRNLV
jgi:hypothetical protein